LRVLGLGSEIRVKGLRFRTRIRAGCDAPARNGNGATVPAPAGDKCATPPRCEIKNLGSRLQDFGFRVLRIRNYGLGFRVTDLGFRVKGLGFRV